METKKQTNTIQVGWIGYVAFFAAILLFSGIFSSSEGPWKVLDFNVLNGSFGKIQGASSSFTFRGANGTGARDGFLFALTLIPTVMPSWNRAAAASGDMMRSRRRARRIRSMGIAVFSDPRFSGARLGGRVRAAEYRSAAQVVL